MKLRKVSYLIPNNLKYILVCSISIRCFSYKFLWYYILKKLLRTNENNKLRKFIGFYYFFQNIFGNKKALVFDIKKWFILYDKNYSLLLWSYCNCYYKIKIIKYLGIHSIFEQSFGYGMRCHFCTILKMEMFT